MIEELKEVRDALAAYNTSSTVKHPLIREHGIRALAALTAQLTKTDDNVSCPSVANAGDINAELLEALKEVEWSKGEFCPICGGSIHGTIGGEIIKTHKDDCKIGKAISRAKQKGQSHE